MKSTNLKIPCPVSLSETAIKEVKFILENKNIPAEYGLRVGVNGGGCSGVSYFLGFDVSKEGDDIYPMEEYFLVIEKKHAMFLWGVEVDFVETGEERGFIFNNK